MAFTACNHITPNNFTFYWLAMWVKQLNCYTWRKSYTKAIIYLLTWSTSEHRMTDNGVRGTTPVRPWPVMWQAAPLNQNHCAPFWTKLSVLNKEILTKAKPLSNTSSRCGCQRRNKYKFRGQDIDRRGHIKTVVKVKCQCQARGQVKCQVKETRKKTIFLTTGQVQGQVWGQVFQTKFEAKFEAVLCYQFEAKFEAVSKLLIKNTLTQNTR